MEWRSDSNSTCESCMHYIHADLLRVTPAVILYTLFIKEVHNSQDAQFTLRLCRIRIGDSVRFACFLQRC
jgi:hypothetical protein